MDPFNSSEEVGENGEDRKLLNWSNWLKEHKAQQFILGEALNRPTDCLIMNLTEDLPLIKTKPVCVSPRRTLKHDAFRDFEIRLALQKTKISRMNDRPELLEVIATPPPLMKEKGINYDRACYQTGPTVMGNTSAWEECRKRFREEIFKPDIEDLLIQGEGLLKVEEEVEKVDEECKMLKKKIPRIIVTDMSEEKMDSNFTTPLELAAGIGFLRIIDHGHPATLKIGKDYISTHKNVFTFPNLPPRGPLEWDINFLNATTNLPNVTTVIIENVGPKVIMYKWTNKNEEPPEISCKRLQNTLPEFFFDASQSVILPGQKAQIQMWFKSVKPGKFSSTWELQTKPKVHFFELLFHFNAVAEEKACGGKPWMKLEKYLNKRVSYSYAKEHVITAYNKMFRDNQNLIPYHRLVSTEKDTFCFTNSYLYVYDPEIVDTLKRRYIEWFQEQWDLNMTTFNSKLMEADQPDMEEYLAEFSALRKKLISHEGKPTKRCHYKYQTVYLILCEMVNQFEEKCAVIREKYELDPVSAPPPIPPERIMGKPRMADSAFDLQIESKYKKSFSSDGKKKKVELKTSKSTKSSSPNKTKSKKDKDSSTNSKNKKYGNAMGSGTKEYIKLIPTVESAMQLLKQKWLVQEDKYKESIYTEAYSLLSRALTDISGVMEGLHWDKSLPIVFDRKTRKKVFICPQFQNQHNQQYDD